MTSLFRLFTLLFVICCSNTFAAVPVVDGWIVVQGGGSSSGIAPNATQAGACSDFGVRLSGRGVLGGGGYPCAARVDEGKPTARLIPGFFEKVSMCPVNSSQTGGSCTCNSGFEEKNGQCVKPDSCSGLAAMCSGMAGNQKSYSTYDGDSETACYQPPDDLFWDQPKFPGCNQGCMAKAGPSTGVTDSTGKTLYKGMGTLTGGLCTYGTPSEPQAPDAPPPAEKTEPVDKRAPLITPRF